MIIVSKTCSRRSKNTRQCILTIAQYFFVYVTPNAEVYHYNLDDLLSKTRVERVAVMTEDDAIKRGLRVSTENNDKNIEYINLSLPGKYRVVFSDGAINATIDVTDQGISASIITNKNSDILASDIVTRKIYPTPSATLVKMHPKTGEIVRPYIIWG